MASDEFESCLEDWSDLEKEYVQLEDDHKKYTQILAEMNAAQKKCVADIAHHRYRIRRIMESLKRLGNDLTANQQEQKKQLLQKINDRKDNFREMEECLPHKNGIYLSIILGQVNISLLDKDDKYRYKQEYEKFKLTVSYVIMFLAIIAFFMITYRWLDALLSFLLVWYYCTLTIRESILIVNGSRIKGWWLTHHFVSTVCAGINVIWPEGETYQQFRVQYILFTIYLSFVYVLQYYYQSGCIYRLRCLGLGHTMDITVEGFMSWMWKGLAFMLPFLFLGYFFQLYNAYTLIELARASNFKEWQLLALAIIHSFLAVGNILTSLNVIRQKLTTAVGNFRRRKYKFRNPIPVPEEEKEQKNSAHDKEQ